MGNDYVRYRGGSGVRHFARSVSSVPNLPTVYLLDFNFCINVKSEHEPLCVYEKLLIFITRTLLAVPRGLFVLYVVDLPYAL